MSEIKKEDIDMKNIEGFEEIIAEELQVIEAEEKSKPSPSEGKEMEEGVITVMFSQDGVILKEGPDDYSLFLNKPGNLKITEYHSRSEVYLEFNIKNDVVVAESEYKEWNIVSIKKQKTESDHSGTDVEEYVGCIKLHIKHIQRVMIIASDTLIQLFSEPNKRWIFDFKCGGSYDFIAYLLKFISSISNLFPKPLSTDYLSSSTKMVPNFATIWAGLIFPVWDRDNMSSLEDINVFVGKGPNLPKRKIYKRGEPLSAEKLISLKDLQGRIIDVDRVKMIICRGGITGDLRPEIWKYLLDYYKWKYTTIEQEYIVLQKTAAYNEMKKQWRNLELDVQDVLFENCKAIRRVVFCTKRNVPYFSGFNNPHVTMLYEILMTYCGVYNSNLGYVQGMDTLLVPILYVLDDEVAAFWCFVEFMNRTGTNLELNLSSVQGQLDHIMALLYFIQPEFSNYLKEKQSDHMTVCFRWIINWFKRKLSMGSTISLWEVLWTGLPCKNFYLLICVSILESLQTMFMKNNYGPDEILKHINEMSGVIDIHHAVNTAHAIYNQLAASEVVPESAASILGLDKKRQSK